MSTLRSVLPASLRVLPVPARVMPRGGHFPDYREAAPVLSLNLNNPARKVFSRMPHEPEDARITGVTRSLSRRLLALNLRGTLRTTQEISHLGAA